MGVNDMSTLNSNHTTDKIILVELDITAYFG